MFNIHLILQIELVRMSKRCDTFRVSAQLFNKYQRIVHNDDDADECNAEQFYSFLVETPLKVIRIRCVCKIITNCVPIIKRIIHGDYTI